MKTQNRLTIISLIGTICIFPLQIHAGSQIWTIGKLEISNAWIRSTPPNAKNGVGYLTISNHGEPDQLIRAETAVSKTTELHAHTFDGDVMRMRQIPFINIRMDGNADLKPGGFHLMFSDLKQNLNTGDTVQVTLYFSKKGIITIKMPVLKDKKMTHSQYHKH